MKPQDRARLQQQAQQAPQPTMSYPAPPPQGAPPVGAPGTVPQMMPPQGMQAPPGKKETVLRARQMSGPAGMSAQLVAADGRNMTPQGQPAARSVRGANVVESPHTGANVRVQGQERTTHVRGAKLVGQQTMAPAVAPMGRPMPMPPQQHHAQPAAPPWIGGGVIQPAAAQQPGVMVADLTIMIAQNARGDLLQKQVESIRDQTLAPAIVAVTINPGNSRLNDQLLNGMERFTAGKDMGPWWRWRIAQEFETKYMLIIDDDCFPGKQWVRRAIERMEIAESRGERIVVACAGARYNSDNYDDLVIIGPEAPTEQEVEVDLGRGGWLLRTEDLDHFHSFPRLGHKTLSIPTHFAASMSYEDDDKERIHTIVLAYQFNDRSMWGMTQPPQSKLSLSFRIDQQAEAGLGYPADWFRQECYSVYRSAGWEPMCVRTEHHNPRPAPRVDPNAETTRLSADDIAE